MEWSCLVSPVEIAAAVKLRLAAELADDLKSVERLAEGVARLAVPGADEWMRALALAFEIDRYFTAVESILLRAIRTLDGDVPRGSARS